VEDPDVWIPTATTGVSAPGLATRADGLSVLLKRLVETRLASEDEILDRLLGELRPPAPPRRGRAGQRAGSVARRG
jgi:formylmethanofuran dehydrogenase subunit B